MPLYIRGPTHSDFIYHFDLKIKFFSAVFSAIAYGIVVVLSGNCLHLLQKKRGIYSNRLRILLLIYVIVMLLSSTWRLIGSVCILMDFLTPPRREVCPASLPRSFAVPLVVTMWGADGFMIWRCLVLYQEVSRGHRIVITVLLSLISLASFGCGIAVIVEGVKFKFDANEVFISLSAVVNIILAVLIVFRLVYHRRYVRNALGAEHGSPYTNIMTMCIESSALMVISSGLCVILEYALLGVKGGGGAGDFLFRLLPHICVISPLLILYRVAIGRAIPPTLLPSEQAMAQIQVNIPVPNPSAQGEV